MRLLLYGRAQFQGVHRRDQLLLCLHGCLESRIGGAFSPEIGPHGENNPRLTAKRQQSVEERPPFVVVRTLGEQFLELVDHDYQVPFAFRSLFSGVDSTRSRYRFQRRLQLGQWMVSRRQVGHLEMGLVPLQGRDQPGQHQR